MAQFPGDADPAVHTSSYTGEHQMWQYTMEGSVPGISQPVDMNVAYFGYDGVEKPKDETPPAEAFPDAEALMDFTQVNEEVTAKVETNLRDIPSQDTDSTVLYTLKNGEIAEQGTHEELLANCEVYRQIAKSQMSEKELGLAGDTERDEQ